MLVTLGTNQGISASSSHTFTYSPNSVQKVFLRLEDADWEDATVTVQIGSKTICNGAKVFGLAGLTLLTSNAGLNAGDVNGFICMDFGSHQCTNNDNLYVTVTAVGELSAVDCSALVDAPGENFPVKITEYSDNTFTSENNLFAICYDAGKAAIEEDTNNCEIRTSISSSSPNFTSASSWYYAESYSTDGVQLFGILNRHAVPLKTTYNYVTNVVDRILTIEQMGTSRAEQSQAKRSARIAMSQAGK